MMTLKYSCLALTVLVLLSSVNAQTNGHDDESEEDISTAMQMLEMEMIEKAEEIQELKELEAMKAMELMDLKEIEALEDMEMMAMIANMTGPGSRNEAQPNEGAVV